MSAVGGGVRIVGMGLELMAEHRLGSFDRESAPFWRFRSAPDLIDEAVEHWDMATAEMHDGELRLFGYYLVRDSALPPGRLVLESMP